MFMVLLNRMLLMSKRRRVFFSGAAAFRRWLQACGAGGVHNPADRTLAFEVREYSSKEAP
jgi:hypothetical protein